MLGKPNHYDRFFFFFLAVWLVKMEFTEFGSLTIQPNYPLPSLLIIK